MTTRAVAVNKVRDAESKQKCLLMAHGAKCGLTERETEGALVVIRDSIPVTGERLLPSMPTDERTSKSQKLMAVPRSQETQPRGICK